MKTNPFGVGLIDQPENKPTFNRVTRDSAYWQLRLFEFTKKDTNRWLNLWESRDGFDGNYDLLLQTALDWDCYTWDVETAQSWWWFGYQPETAATMWANRWTHNHAWTLGLHLKYGSDLNTWLLVGATPQETIRLAREGVDPFMVVHWLREGHNLTEALERVRENAA